MIENFNVDFEEAVTLDELQAEKDAIVAGTQEATLEAAKIKADEEANAKLSAEEKLEKETKEKEAAEKAKTGELTAEQLEAEKKAGLPADDSSTEDQVIAAVQGYASFLKEQGVFGDKVNIEDIKSTEDLIKAQTSELEEWKADYLNSVPPIVKQLLENYEEGVPLTDLINIKSNQIKYSTITEDKLKESVGLQKDLYKTYLKETTKFSDKKIADMITKAEDDFTLETLVTDDVLPELKKAEEEKEQELVKITKKQQEEAKAANEERIQHYQATINKVEEFIPGIKVSKDEKTNIYKNMVTPVAKDGYGNPVTLTQAVYMKDPAKFDAFVTYMVMKSKGLEDFSFISTQATTAATKSLEKNFLEKAPRKTTGTGVASKTETNLLEAIQRGFK
jgi:hypothetical protein